MNLEKARIWDKIKYRDNNNTIKVDTIITTYSKRDRVGIASGSKGYPTTILDIYVLELYTKETHPEEFL